jgi:transposase-like protein
MNKVRVCYTAKFKLEVVRYAQEDGNRAARIQFDVGGTNVKRWPGEEKLEVIF